MPLYTKGPITNDQKDAFDFEAPFGEYLGAMVEQGLRDLPTAQGVRADMVGEADAPVAMTPEDAYILAADPMAGVDAPGLIDKARQLRRDSPEAQAARMSKGDALDKAKAAGVDINVPDRGLTPAATDLLIREAQERNRRALIMERHSAGWGSVAGWGSYFGLQLLDPVNIGTAFVPVIGEARYAQMLARGTQAAGGIGRFGVRAGVGATEGVVGSAIVEPMIYSNEQVLNADYGMVDSLTNIAFGGILGGGLHSVGGGIADIYRARTGAAQPWAAQAPVEQALADVADIPSMVQGAGGEVRVGDEYVPVQWAVVDAGDVRATMEKADNQFRDRSRVASDEQIREIANKIDFRMLGDSPVIDMGAPTMSRDGRIIGGNGRMAAIDMAYDIGKGQQYRDAMREALADLGIDEAAIERMKKPALVRVLQKDVNIREAAILSNEGGAMRMSALEQAKVDAERMGDFRAFEVTDAGDVATAGNRGFIRQWVDKYPKNQRNALVDADGMLSAEGLRRLQNGILFRAYGDSPTLSRLIEATDPGSRNIAAAMTRAASTVADANAGIASGDLWPVGIEDDLRAAVEKFDDLRRRGSSVGEFFDQLDAFGSGLTPEAEKILRFIGENIRSPRAMASMVTRYYDLLRQAGGPNQGDMFGGGAPTKGELLDAAVSDAKADGSAAAVVEAATPQQRQAATRAAVNQAVSGREIEVEPIMRNGGRQEFMDAAERLNRPEAVRVADFDAAAEVEARAGQKSDVEALVDEAVTMANEVAAGARFARVESESDRAPAEAIVAAARQSFGDATDSLIEAGRIEIVGRTTDLPFDVPSDVKGVELGGRVYLVAENLTPAEVRGVVLHEVGVHAGMRGLLGDDMFEQVLADIDARVMAGEKEFTKAREYAALYAAKPEHIREETLAYLVQNAPELGWVQELLAKVRAAIYQLTGGKLFDLSQADLQMLAVAALRKSANDQRIARMAQPAFSRGGDLPPLPEVEELTGDAAGGNVAETAPGAHGDAIRTTGRDGRTYVSGRNAAGASPAAGWGKATAVVLRRAGGERTPAVVWRGGRTGEVTAANFAPDAIGQATRNPSAALGVWLTSAQGDAAKYGKARPFFLDIRNPKVLRTDDVPEFKSQADAAAMRERLAAEGYDGIILDYRDSDPRAPVHFVVFRPEQVIEAAEAPKFSRGQAAKPNDVASELNPFDEAIKRAEMYGKAVRAAAERMTDDDGARAAMDAAAGGKLSDAEIEDLLDELKRENARVRSSVRKYRGQVTAEDAAASLQDAAMRAAETVANNVKLAAEIEKRNAALNIAAKMRGIQHVMQFADKREGFFALLSGSAVAKNGSRQSVQSEQKAFAGRWLGGMIADLEQSGLWQLFVSDTMSRETMEALSAMTSGQVPDPSLPKQAVQMAEIVHRYFEDSRTVRNRFGAWIRDLSGYTVRQSHDMFKIRKAGFQSWRDFVLPRLDVERTLRDFPDTDLEAFLRGAYDDFAAGLHLEYLKPEDVAPFKGPGNLAKKQSASRVIYLKDASSEHAYLEEFGVGRFSEAVLQQMTSAANSAGLLKVLGTNPRANLEAMMDGVESMLVGDPDARRKFHEQRSQILSLTGYLDGQANIPGNAMAARVGANLRAWQSMAKLGGALISSMTDLAVYGSEVKYQGRGGYLSGMAEGIGGLVRGRRGAERRQMLMSMGVFFDSMVGQVNCRFDADDLMGGTSSFLMQKFFKWNGLQWWTESLRMSSALSYSAHLADLTGKNWDKVGGEMQRVLGLYRIDAGKWDVLRMAGTREADGRRYLTPEGLDAVPAAALENYIRESGRTVTPAAVENLRDDLRQTLRTMIIDRGEHAVIEPDARTRWWLLRGQPPGTVWGETARFIAQFKGFPVAILQRTLGREVYGKGSESLSQALRNGNGEMLGLVQLMAWMTLMGYGAMATKDMLKGKAPRPPDDYRTWQAAMLQGGGAGIYGDFLFGEMRNRFGSGLLSTVAGPVLGTASDVADLWGRVRAGDDAGARAFKLLLQNTPFMNLFYTRIAMDYLFLYNLQEQMNPGYLRRMERRVEQENGQKWLLRPSEVAR